MVVPAEVSSALPLSALLAWSPLNLVVLTDFQRNQGPPFSSVLLHQLPNCLIFLAVILPIPSLTRAFWPVLWPGAFSSEPSDNVTLRSKHPHFLSFWMKASLLCLLILLFLTLAWFPPWRASFILLGILEIWIITRTNNCLVLPHPLRPSMPGCLSGRTS